MWQHTRGIFAEFRRALAAAESYEGLKYGSACRDRSAQADIPRRIFEQYYAGKSGSELAARSPITE
jgi:hypothetical protein